VAALDDLMTLVRASEEKDGKLGSMSREMEKAERRQVRT
jgi:hypothetical protein